MKKLKQLPADCRKAKLEDVDLKIKALVDSLDQEGLVEVIELSDQPVKIECTSSEGESMEDFSPILRPAAVEVIEGWLTEQLEHDICEMAYGDYLIIVDHWLDRGGHESTSEEEMAVVDQMQCDLELPHVCAKTILEIRNGG